MHPTISRRHFLRGSFGTAVSLTGLGVFDSEHAEAIPPLQRAGSSRLMLSMAAYSFRDSFRDSAHKQAPTADPSKRIDMFQFIDYCAEHGCYGTELTSYYFPASLNDEYLLRVKHHAFMRGIAISGTAVGNTFTVTDETKRKREVASVKQWIDRAQLMGAPHIRVFAGSAERGLAKAEAQKLAIDALQECCEYAATKGVMLGLENHGGIVAEPDDLLTIVQAVNSPWFGVNLDTGNFQTADPYSDLARCAPYAVNVQIKSEIQPRGQKKALSDLPRLVKILRDANYQGYVALEYEAAEDPWQAVPGILAHLRELMA
jgi:sugar phosphate isomerase/epimerase